MFPGLVLYYTDPAQPLTTAREELDDLDHDLSDLPDLSEAWMVWEKMGPEIRPKGGVLINIHGRSRMIIYPRIPTMPGRSMSGFHRPGRHR